MTDFNTDLNIQFPIIQPIQLIHEASSTEYYYGTSSSGSDTSKPIWQIKKITKTGAVWAVSLFPNGDQFFNYIWDDRLTYTYL